MVSVGGLAGNRIVPDCGSISRTILPIRRSSSPLLRAAAEPDSTTLSAIRPGEPILVPVAATVPAIVFTQFGLPRVEALYASTVGLVPRFALHGLAGYTVALTGDDECGFLKGVAGGVLAEALFNIVRG